MPNKQAKGCLASILGTFAPTQNDASSPPADEPLPYLCVESLVSKGEHAFYVVLLQAVQERYLICPKVGLGDLLRIQSGSSNWRKHRNRIQSKHVDFVLADTQTLRPLLAIELDDATHKRPTRQDRDTFVESACEAAGLSILRVPAKASYNAQDLARSIDAAI